MVFIWNEEDFHRLADPCPTSDLLSSTQDRVTKREFISMAELLAAA